MQCCVSIIWTVLIRTFAPKLPEREFEHLYVAFLLPPLLSSAYKLSLDLASREDPNVAKDQYYVWRGDSGEGQSH